MNRDSCAGCQLWPGIGEQRAEDSRKLQSGEHQKLIGDPPDPE